MNTRIHKASGENVPDLNLVASEPWPDAHEMGPDWEQSYRANLSHEAQRIADALSASLPGGVLHHLLAELMRRQACLLAVPIFDPVRERDDLLHTAEAVLRVWDVYIADSDQITPGELIEGPALRELRKAVAKAKGTE